VDARTLPRQVPAAEIARLFEALRLVGAEPAEVLFASTGSPGEPLLNAQAQLVPGDELQLFGATPGRWYSVALPGQALPARRPWARDWLCASLGGEVLALGVWKRRAPAPQLVDKLTLPLW